MKRAFSTKSWSDRKMDQNTSIKLRGSKPIFLSENHFSGLITSYFICVNLRHL